MSYNGYLTQFSKWKLYLFPTNKQEGFILKGEVKKALNQKDESNNK